MIVYTKDKIHRINNDVYELQKKLYVNELQLQRNVNDFIKKLKQAKVLTAWHPKEQYYDVLNKKYGSGTKGIPDIIGFHKGKGFAMELKIRKRKLTPHQIKIKDELVNIGNIPYCVCGCMQEVYDFFKIFLRINIDKMYMR